MALYEDDTRYERTHYHGPRQGDDQRALAQREALGIDQGKLDQLARHQPGAHHNSISARLTGDRPDWMAGAACRGAGPDRFFATDDTERRSAAFLCAGCPVREACLEYALTHNLDAGVWGGRTEAERRSIRRRRQRGTRR